MVWGKTVIELKESDYVRTSAARKPERNGDSCMSLQSQAGLFGGAQAGKCS